MTDRFIDVVLADPSHKLPMPGAPRLFSPEGEKVDGWDPFWLALLADGSIKPREVAAPPAISASIALPEAPAIKA